MPPRIKCAANYQNARMALLQAEGDGYDGALMLDASGHVTEEARGCVFAVRDGVAMTPPVTNDILESITRDTVIRLLREVHGVEVVEREIDRTGAVRGRRGLLERYGAGCNAGRLRGQVRDRGRRARADHDGPERGLRGHRDRP